MLLRQRALPLAVLALPLIVLPASGQDAPRSRTRPPRPLPVVTVEANYPWANARDVADAVAAPIEQQVNGVEKMAYLRSRSTNDGSYTLHVVFPPGTDLVRARRLVGKRVILAEPGLPDAVKLQGVAVKKRPPHALLFIPLFSPGGRFDTLYLSNYATIQIKDELARVPGVADVALIGQRDYSMRVWLDPDKLASRNLTAGEVIRALQKQNAQAAADKTGKAPAAKGRAAPITVETRGGLTNPEAFMDLIVKTGPKGRTVRLKDVGRVEWGASGKDGYARFDGKPAVALAVSPTGQARPREVGAGVRKMLSRLRKRFPDDLDYHLGFDFTPGREAPDRAATSDYLLLDPDLPAAVSPERAVKVLGQCEALLLRVPGVKHVLTLSENPFDIARDRPCLLVNLAPAGRERPGRDGIKRDIRAKLKEVKAVPVRLRDLTGPDGLPRWSYPLDLAVSGPEQDQVNKLAQNLGERLRRRKELTDVWVDPDATPRPQAFLDIDVENVKTMGVQLTDVFEVLQAYLGSYHVNDFNRFGRTWRVEVQTVPRSFKRLQVRNARGDMVPLAQFVKTRKVTGPLALDRLDGQPLVAITANPAPGVSLVKARKLCEAVIAEARKELRLPAPYRLTWLGEAAAHR